MCPTLQDDTEQANAIGEFSGPPQRKYDPYSNNYNPGWKDHPNFRLGGPQFQNSQPKPHFAQQNPSTSSDWITRSLKYVIKKREIEISQSQSDQTKAVVGESLDVVPPNVPFPSSFSKSKKEDEGKEILGTFRKVEVNIPLLDEIKQIPRYVKFLKELCTNIRKLKDNEFVSMDCVYAWVQK
ncbi:hypothetical protein ACS0TY_006862 [Phlomoides rotata]